MLLTSSVTDGEKLTVRSRKLEQGGMHEIIVGEHIRASDETSRPPGEKVRWPWPSPDQVDVSAPATHEVSSGVAWRKP